MLESGTRFLVRSGSAEIAAAVFAALVGVCDDPDREAYFISIFAEMRIPMLVIYLLEH